ncbi:MAG: hypothetical protein E6J78_06445 [Deltaproteobacteria bacterium]|nr:MAG: hypothetical protein E6J78_06445 [Deltaproteobacteria bacterium]
MRRLQEELADIRVPPEALARWALETAPVAQEATCSALSFLLHVEHAAATLLPAPALLCSEQAVIDPDGFLRLPRGAVEHFRLRSRRAAAWMDLYIFFRERFPAAAQRQPPEALYSLAQLFKAQDDDLDSACSLIVREAIVPQIEEVLARSLTYPPLQALLQSLRGVDAPRSAEARKLAAEVLGDLSGARLWKFRTRLVTAATRALLAAKPLLDELERGGFKVDRTRAARAFARRLEEAVSELPGGPLLENILRHLAGPAGDGALR